MLESIRDLMNEETVLPEWLHDIFLGYGDPAAAQYSKLPNTLRTLDFKVHLTMTHACLGQAPIALGSLDVGSSWPGACMQCANAQIGQLPFLVADRLTLATRLPSPLCFTCEHGCFGGGQCLMKGSASRRTRSLTPTTSSRASQSMMWSSGKTRMGRLCGPSASPFRSSRARNSLLARASER